VGLLAPVPASAGLVAYDGTITLGNTNAAAPAAAEYVVLPQAVYLDSFALYNGNPSNTVDVNAWIRNYGVTNVHLGTFTLAAGGGTNVNAGFRPFIAGSAVTNLFYDRRPVKELWLDTSKASEGTNAVTTAVMYRIFGDTSR
jgi:hypothetical protein